PCAALLVLTCWLPKETEAGERPTAGAVAAVERSAIGRASGGVSVIVTAPLRAPLAVGVNVTLIVQVPLAARVEGLSGQVLVWAKSLLFAPVMAMPVMESGTLPVLVRVTPCAALPVTTCWLPKETEVGERPTVGAVADVKNSAMFADVAARPGKVVRPMPS